MNGTRHIDAHIIALIGGFHTYIFHPGIVIQLEVFYKIDKLYTAPMRYLVPALYAFKIIDDLGLWQRPQFLDTYL